MRAADQVILDGSDGTVEETDHLTAEVAQRFTEKTAQAAYATLRRKDLE